MVGHSSPRTSIRPLTFPWTLVRSCPKLIPRQILDPHELAPLTRHVEIRYSPDSTESLCPVSSFLRVAVPIYRDRITLVAAAVFATNRLPPSPIEKQSRGTSSEKFSENQCGGFLEFSFPPFSSTLSRATVMETSAVPVNVLG